MTMSCFDWQNRSSDYLDGTLIGPLRREADEHLDTCKSCSERHQHYRLILSSISSQPRSTLPVPIRKSPLAFTLPRTETHGRRTRWERTPWFVRTSVEGLGVALTILFVVAMVPRLRSLYERSVERRLDAYNAAELALESDAAKAPGADAPLQRGRPAGDLAASGDTDDFAGETESDALLDDEEHEETQAILDEKGKPVRVGSSEIWRFNLKTDSPHEIRPKIVQTLTALHVPADTPGLGGIEAPGGIQFDLLVPLSVVPGLKNQLQRLAPHAPRAQVIAANEAGTTPGSGSFTWYKNKSRRKIPPGKARVVIWLSQM
jgi:hypothetical protein